MNLTLQRLSHLRVKNCQPKDWDEGKDWDGDEGEDEGGDAGEDEGEDEEVKPSTSEKKLQIINLDKGITDEYKNLLEEKGLPLPSEILKEGLDPDKFVTKVNDKIKRNEDYIKSHSTKKGQPFKKLKKIQLSTYQRHKMENTIPQRLFCEIKPYQRSPKIYG